MKAFTKVIRFFQNLSIPEGPTAGHKMKLVAFQKQLVKRTLVDEVNVAVRSTGRKGQ